MKNNRQYLLDGTRIAMAYIGTVIGAGFASGQEIMQFFTRFGYQSFWAILLSTILFITIGKKILLLGKRLNAKSYGVLIDHVFGITSPLVNLYLAVSFILLCGAMFAGGGALLLEHLGIPFLIGALITALLTLVVTICGMQGILTANTIIVPSITLFSFIILIYVIRHSYIPADSLQVIPGELMPLIRTGVTYASFNLILSIGVLAPMGGIVKDIRALYIGSIMGGCLLGVMLLINNYSLLHFTPEVFHKEIPLLFIVKGMGTLFVGVYGIIIWLEIFSTAIGNLFAITTIIQEKFKITSNIPAVVVTLIGMLICLLGFSTIVSWFYPILGIIGFVLVGIILVQT